MATKPADRYATCRALAEDVERWTADEPVSAWREPLGGAQRWARRHRPLVTAAVAAVLVALAGLGAVLAVQRGANRMLASKNDELDRANRRPSRSGRAEGRGQRGLSEANGRVQARFELAREAIRSFKAGVEEEGALKEDRLRPLRDKLLGSARRFYDRLGDLLRGPDRRRLEGGAGRVVHGAGRADRQDRPETGGAGGLQEGGGDPPRAGGAAGGRRSARVELARALSGLGGEAVELGDHARALAAHEEARSLAEPLARAGATIEARRALGRRPPRGRQRHSRRPGRSSRRWRPSVGPAEVRETLARDAAAVPDDRRSLAGPRIESATCWSGPATWPGRWPSSGRPRS